MYAIRSYYVVEQAILASVEALKKRDIDAARQILKDDREINKKRFEIENKLMILIATQQPMAHDLRLLASSMEIIGELERMGDYAKGIVITSYSIHYTKLYEMCS